MDARLTEQIKATLGKSSLVKGSNVKITSKVNPSILGGMFCPWSCLGGLTVDDIGLVVEIGDKTIDLSISSRLAKLNKLITEAV